MKDILSLDNLARATFHCVVQSRCHWNSRWLHKPRNVDEEERNYMCHGSAILGLRPTQCRPMDSIALGIMATLSHTMTNHQL